MNTATIIRKFVSFISDKLVNTLASLWDEFQRSFKPSRKASSSVSRTNSKSVRKFYPDKVTVFEVVDPKWGHPRGSRAQLGKFVKANYEPSPGVVNDPIPFQEAKVCRMCYANAEQVETLVRLYLEQRQGLTKEEINSLIIL